MTHTDVTPTVVLRSGYEPGVIGRDPSTTALRIDWHEHVPGAGRPPGGRQGRLPSQQFVAIADHPQQEPIG